MTTLVAVDSGSTALPYVTGTGGNTNWVEQIGGAEPHTQTAGAATTPTFACISALAITAQNSGVFDIYWNVACSPSITADTISHELVLVPFTAPTAPVFTAATGMTAAGILSNATLAAASQVTANLAGYTAYLAADAQGVGNQGLLYNGAAINSSATNAQQLDTLATPSLTGLLTAQGGGTIQFRGALTVPKAQNPKVGWPIGTVLVIGIGVKSLHSINGTITYQTCYLRAEERGNG